MIFLLTLRKKMSFVYKTLIVFLIQLTVFVNGFGFNSYPKHLISRHEFPDEVIYDFPYCDRKYCHLFVSDKKINLYNKYPYNLDYDVKLRNDIDISNIKLRNYQSGMELVIGKKPDNFDMKKSDAPWPLPVEPIDNYLEVIDISEVENYTKDFNAVSGYYNLRNQWINY